MLLNNEWVKNEIREEIKKFLETNKNELTTERFSPLERVAALSLFPHRTFVVLVYVYWNTETSTADPAGRDLCHKQTNKTETDSLIQRTD